MTLTNLGILLRRENQLAEARQAYAEALKIYERFAKSNPLRYQRDVVRVKALLESLEAPTSR